ncbi:MAG TPA: GNAT family N-acetyltransferase [Bryobacteraceae bacterium]|jgi:GNAT superfamily N-acetyltransferase
MRRKLAKAGRTTVFLPFRSAVEELAGKEIDYGTSGLGGAYFAAERQPFSTGCVVLRMGARDGTEGCLQVACGFLEDNLLGSDFLKSVIDFAKSLSGWRLEIPAAGDGQTAGLLSAAGFACDVIRRRAVRCGNSIRDYNFWGLLLTPAVMRGSAVSVTGRPASPLMRRPEIHYQIQRLTPEMEDEYLRFRHGIDEHSPYLLASSLNSREHIGAHSAQPPDGNVSDRTITFVAVLPSGDIIATIQVWPGEWMDTAADLTLCLCVRPEFRGFGVGFALLKYLENWAASALSARLTVEVIPDNVPAIALYRKCGFQVEGRRVNACMLCHRMADVLVMAKYVSGIPKDKFDKAEDSNWFVVQDAM